MPEQKFCIKKNEGSFMNPWLCEFRGQLCYAGLDMIVTGTAAMKQFGSEDQAQRFIKGHPEICSDRNVICELKVNGVKVEIISPPATSAPSPLDRFVDLSTAVAEGYTPSGAFKTAPLVDPDKHKL